MKVAVVYNRESRSVVNLFGLPNKEMIGLKTIGRIVNALRQGGHQVISLEGDKDLINRLEEFMPRVLQGERPGMVFNLSYGIQGQARYTHVPSILEMVGVPYVASGPLAHSLSLDKVVTKMILRQHGLPTPDFAVLEAPDSQIPPLRYPMIVKPKNEAVSFGLKVVHDEAELREAAAVIFEAFRQAVLVEQYIDGREVNVGLLGNDPPEALPPVELVFPEDGPQVYTYEDKTGRSGRTITPVCPAPIGEELQKKAQTLALGAFRALGCADCARVDLRMDADGNLFILEVNSLPSLGEHGSYTVGAQHVGLDFPALVNRLVAVASARYFGTPEPTRIVRTASDPVERVFSFVTQRRDEMEQSLHDWVRLSSHTSDPVGVREAVRRADRILREMLLAPVDELTDERMAWCWQTQRGYDGGTLVVSHVDVPGSEDQPAQPFRRTPEWLYGTGIGLSRAPLVMLEFALRAVRSARKLRRERIGVLLYMDEGRDARYSAPIIRKAASRAARVLVLRAGNPDDTVVVQRRGHRRYRFRAEGEPSRPGASTKKTDVLRWMWGRLEVVSQLTDKKRRLSVSTVDLNVDASPGLLPHRATAFLVMTYPAAAAADELEAKIRALIGRGGPRWELELVADRPPMVEKPSNLELAERFCELGKPWDIPVKRDTSISPSVAGLVPEGIGCLCGLGPVARDLGTPHEAIRRISLAQRTFLLARFLLGRADGHA